MEIEKAYYKQLIGKTVMDVIATNEDFLSLLFTDGTEAQIQCDPEGNGPGFLSIDPDENQDS